MTILVHRAPTCWTINLDRPDKANALSGELVEALLAAVVEAGGAGVEGTHPCLPGGAGADAGSSRAV